MQDDSILTQEELDFLRSLQDNQKPDPLPVGLLLEGGKQAKELLARLAAHEQLTIEAHIDSQRITFPLHVIEDEFHALHLQLGTPTIVEQTSADRPWRLPLDPPVNLVDEHGEPSLIWLHAVSQSGMLVEVRGQPVPKRFSLWLPIPGRQPIALQGILARKAGEGLTAYRQSLRKTRHSERLRSFILEQHQQLHGHEAESR
ncbi:hypothetical protein JQX08_05225 [Pseudomonas sp. UL073]|uniref:PilZ domain-containing protein n=1 Tax=Zestomonas insulae TaxID=2809017 RepID=A0ABS2IAR4_9GAMM|nr:hypothetical protein [Pseudomonas insulae]MBM7060102.1 hypothetical protein [Pseudomonas insulae]